MNLLTHLHLALQTWLRDLFSEEELLPEAAQRNNVDSLLTEAQAALNALRADWARAIAVEHRAEQAWLAAATQAQAMDVTIDTDLRAGLEHSARAKTVQLMALQDRAQQLSAYYSQTQAAVARLQTAVETLQKYLDEARRKRLALNERQQLVELLLGLDRLDRELTRNSELLSDELQTHEAIVQRGEDRLAAREEWKRR